MRNDHTVAHNGKLYQVEEDAKSRKVTVEERIDGSTHLVSHGVSLKYKEITERPVKATPVRKAPKPRVAQTPPADHPWRRAIRGRKRAAGSPEFSKNR